MGALLGTLSAIAIGISDLFGRRAVRAGGALAGAAVVSLFAIVSSAAAVLLLGTSATGTDLVLGAVSGVGLGLGLLLYYGGIVRSSSSVVSPVVAAMSAIIPFGWAIVAGARPSALAYAGAVVTIAGVVGITVGGGGAAHVLVGLRWGLVSGLAYGTGFAVVLETSADAGAWPALWQRIAATAVLGTVAVHRRVAVAPPAGARATAAIGGLLAGLTTVLYLAGARFDPTATVITSSMFPAASVAVGWAFFGDHVTRAQVMAIGVMLAGVAAVVAG